MVDHIINPLLTKLVWSTLLVILNLVNIQSSWPHAWTITHLSSLSCLAVAEVLKLPYSLVLVPPPKSVRLLATNKKELTVHWKRPPELKDQRIDYKLLLKPQDHQSTPCIQVQYVNNWYWYNEEQLVTKFRNNWTHSNFFGFWLFFDKE